MENNSYRCFAIVICLWCFIMCVFLFLKLDKFAHSYSSILIEGAWYGHLEEIANNCADDKVKKEDNESYNIIIKNNLWENNYASDIYGYGDFNRDKEKNDILLISKSPSNESFLLEVRKDANGVESLYDSKNKIRYYRDSEK